MTSAASNDDLDILTRTVWGAARRESDEGKAAVAHVIMNRFYAVGYGNSIARICLKDKQFSYWNSDDVNYQKIKKLKNTDKDYRHIYGIVEDAVNKRRPDKTYKSKHSHVESVPHYWPTHKKPAAKISNHVFYNDID
ncbi:unnamed protein product [Adineta ricciae]|uniref:Cell wall hydrolase SleB domain-containing protein n=1 Tax=Adineta ricciae TaxID=249248 RepID=A0A814RMC0_ADIRI|nr:unnamed protein product [Adineta ricciae]CAF1374503.1 unnamed protein product [Adineta ricciae]